MEKLSWEPEKEKKNSLFPPESVLQKFASIYYLTVVVNARKYEHILSNTYHIRWQWFTYDCHVQSLIYARANDDTQGQSSIAIRQQQRSRMQTESKQLPTYVQEILDRGK